MPRIGPKNNRSNRGAAKQFWDNEYQNSTHLKMSSKPSEDLVKFCLWQERQFGKKWLNQINSAIDIGCGNGRNLIYLSQNYGLRGVGLDIAKPAIDVASSVSAEHDLPLTFTVGTIEEPLPVADHSQAIALDLMVSHYLPERGRLQLASELSRILKPNGWLMFKTFLLDEDDHAKRLIREHPASEVNSYIHPQIGVMEHVFTIPEIEELLGADFTIHKIIKSQKHRGSQAMRRSVVVYAQKN